MSTKPFDSSHFVGYVKKVSPDYVTGHIPASRLLSLYHHFGEKFHSGIVGNFVVIEGEEFKSSVNKWLDRVEMFYKSKG